MNKFKIPLVRSVFVAEADTRKRLADFVINTERFSMGKECADFERAFAKKQGRKYAVLVNSGSSANLALIQALLNLGRLKKGDKVGVSAVTWSTNVMPLIQLGLHPIGIDCELEHLNVSSDKLKERLDSIQGLFLTNVLGLCGDIYAIRDTCRDKGVLLMEDNCESLGSSMQGTLLGNFGLASTFSLFLGHHLSTLEGGVVCTDDDDLHDMLVMVRSHGWARNLSPEKERALREKHHIDPFYGLYTFYDCGYNIRPTEIQGFLGNTQIPHWDLIVKRREENFMEVQKAVRGNDHLIPIKFNHMDKVSSFAMPLLFKERSSYERYKTRLNQGGVEVRPIIAGNITNQPFYKKYVSDVENCPNADYVSENGFYFGNNQDITDKEIDFIKSLLA